MVWKDRHWFSTCAAAVWVYVVVRAWVVPLVHDECASLLWYVYPAEWLPGSAHGDANNHFVSTGLGTLFTHLFGLHPISLRLGSVLGFVPYAWGCWRLGNNVASVLVRWCMWAALLACPFVLDFFSLFRGYAIEIAGWVVALDGVLRFVRKGATRHLFQTLFAALIATASIIALVPVWALLLFVLVAFVLIHHHRALFRMTMQLIAIAGFGAFPLLYASRIAMGMQEQGLLYHGSKAGFLPVTIASLTRYVIGSDSASWSVVIVMVVAVLLPMVLARSFKRVTSAALLAVMLIIDIASRHVLARWFGVNYPEDRAGLHYVPLMVVLLALVFDELTVRENRMRFAALGLLLLPVRSLVTANTNHTLLWPEQSIPARFVATVQRETHDMGRNPVIGGYHQLALSWPMNASLRGGQVLPLQVEGFPAVDDDLRIVDGRFLREAREGYRVLDSAMGPGLWLLQRTAERSVRILDTLVAANMQGEDEFFELAHLPDTLIQHGRTFIDATCQLRVDDLSSDAGWVIEVNDSAGGKLLYDRVPLFAMRPRWQGNAWQVTRMLPALPAARRAVLYFHNPGAKIFTVSAATTLVGKVR